MLNECGILREYTPVGSPKHDGVVERRIAMTLELATASRDAGACDGVPPGGPRSVRRREDGADATPMG